MRTFLLVIILAIFVSSCNEKSNKNNDQLKQETNIYDTQFNNKKELKNLLDKAMLHGDTIAYNKAFKAYTLANHYTDFFYYSVTMAQSHGYSQAYFDTYSFLVDDYPGNYNQQKTSNFAFFCLLKAYEKGNKNAKYTVKELYSTDIPKSSEYLKKME